MNWLNLTALQAAVFFAGAAALATWFYYRERRVTRLRVSTLQFWPQAQVSLRPLRQLRHRKAWIAQLIFLLLLILAIADIRQRTASSARSVAIVLDTSIWSQVTDESGRPYIELEREEAGRILSSLGEDDRVLVVRAETAPSPLVPFTSNKAALRQALATVQPSSTVADLPRALEIARSALGNSPGGSLVYVGPGRLDAQQVREMQAFEKRLQAQNEPQLSVRLVGATTLPENCGITNVALQRDAERANVWHMLTKVTNYGQSASNLNLEILLNESTLGRQQVSVGPGRTVDLEHEIRTANGGLLELRMVGDKDALDVDNRAVLSLPRLRNVRVAIVTSDSGFAQMMRAVLATHHDVAIEVRPPGKRAESSADIEIYSDPPSGTTAANSIRFLREPARNVAPFLRIGEWNAQHPATQWIRTHDVIVRRVAEITPSPGEIVLARGEDRRPLISAREEDGRKTLVVGFDPRYSNLLRQDAFPLLVAGALEWMAGAAEDTVDFHSAGTVNLGGTVTEIRGPSNEPQSLARSQNGTFLLAPQAGVYRVRRPEGEVPMGVNAPPLPTLRWKPLAGDLAPNVVRPWQGGRTPFWSWLVLLSAVALWAEWWLFYSKGKNQKLSIAPRENASRDAMAGLKIS